MDGCMGGSLNAVNSRAPVELIRVQDILNFQLNRVISLWLSLSISITVHAISPITPESMDH